MRGSVHKFIHISVALQTRKQTEQDLGAGRRLALYAAQCRSRSFSL